MRSIWISRAGPPSVLEVREERTKTPKPGEVRVAVHAAGLNFAEVMARQGLYPDCPPLPCVVGYEVAGVVDAIGEGASRFKEGDRVAALTRFGGHTTSLCVPENHCFAIPDAMTFEEGAALPVNYLTAYHMLFQIFRLRAGEHVLIHMAAGGVGTAALQLCATVPDVVTYGTASARKHAYVKSHGCTHAIDYRSKDYEEEVRRLVGERGVDLVLDALGGRDWKKGYSLLRSSGMLIAFGFANMNVGGRKNLFHIAKQITGVPLYTPIKLMDTNRAIAGVNLGHLWHEIEMLREQGDALIALYNEGKIKPHIDRVFSYDDAADAHEYLESGQNVGKVILVP